MERSAGMAGDKKKEAEAAAAAGKARKMGGEVSERKILQDIIGRTIGQCLITSMLGRGGMGAVFKAVHTGIKRETAVKILPKSFNPDPERVRRFFREAESLGKLRHPNIVEIYNVGEEESLYFIEMEYVQGSDLEDVIRRGPPMDAERMLRIMKEICRGLKEAHDHNIIHRDLKPANVLIASDGRVKIVDFGVAKSLEKEEDLTVEGSLIGTPQYMSPEQCRGEQLDRRSDIYSLGALFYYLLCRRKPFESDNPMMVILKHLREDVEPPRKHNPSIDPSYNSIVERMMAKDPAERYQTVDEVLDHLDDISAGRAVMYTSRRTRRRRIAAAAAVLAALIAAAAAVFFAPRPGSPAAAPAAQPQAETWIAEGMGLLDTGRFEAAMEKFSRAAAADPSGKGPKLLEVAGILSKAAGLKKAGMHSKALDGLEASFGRGFWEKTESEARDAGKSLGRELDLRVRFEKALGRADFGSAAGLVDGILLSSPGDASAAADKARLARASAAISEAGDGSCLATLKELLDVQAGDIRWSSFLKGEVAKVFDRCLARAESMRKSGDLAGAVDLAAELKSLFTHDERIRRLSERIGKELAEKESYEGFRRSAEEAFSAGDFERASDLYRKAAEVKSSPDLDARIAESTALGLEKGAISEQAAGRIEKAIDLLGRAVTAAGNLPELMARLQNRLDSCRGERRSAILSDVRKSLEAGDLKSAGDAVRKGLELFAGDAEFAAEAAEIGRIERTPAGMVYVRGGTYPVGREGEAGNPPRKVGLRAFYVSKREVTAAEFAKFVEARGYENEGLWDPEGWKAVSGFLDREGAARSPGNWFRGGPPPGSADKPVAHVSWFEADAYARFRGMRLPSEEEWEVAASYDPRTGRQLSYPWGDAWKSGIGNLLAEGREAAPADAGSAAGDVSPLGCLNMAGNVAEWTSTRWQGEGRLHVIRGTSASYENPSLAARAARRTQRGDPAKLRIAEVGFRLAKDAE